MSRRKARSSKNGKMCIGFGDLVAIIDLRKNCLSEGKRMEARVEKQEVIPRILTVRLKIEIR